MRGASPTFWFLSRPRFPLSTRDPLGRFQSSGRVTVKDRGLRKIRRELEKASGNVVIGVGLGKSATYEDGTSVVDVAVWNHFGTDRIPERPFISGTMEEKRSEIKAFQLRLSKGIYEGKITQEQALEFVGRDLQSKIVSKINDFFPPRNAPSTIAQKKSSKPLIDTKQLVGSINYEVRK